MAKSTIISKTKGLGGSEGGAMGKASGGGKRGKVISTGALPMGKTPTAKPYASNPSGGKKRQAPSVVVS